ncbi:multiple monosaccharide ABC transporter membrane protein [Alkalispirochaeta americana]|uniref:Xylose transport system permease protein XylH n=1 Tax=Alkalispirochaeta americana TaxID=159291 RepID=A0A1N6ULU5_9SPIO|nr:multiple monosaccharide ABC transporter permease [Alkalispirochaeta americana]SIQ66600.1 multiple monosaccharide ABC transporter membrane protein [Alkalispirochaeta americana]
MNSLMSYFKSNVRQNGMVIALVSIMLLFQVLTAGILFRPMNITNLVLQNSYVLILAIGMLLCILTGNIDLSVGSVVAFVGAVSAVMMVDMNLPVPVTIVLALLLGVLVGAFHGFFIAFLRIPAFIVTLGGMLIFRGLTMVILQGQTKAPFSRSFQILAAGYLPGRDLEIGGYNVVAMIAGTILAVLFSLYLVRSRKTKLRYGFDVLPLGIEAGRIILLVLAIGWFSLRLAAYNGIPVVLVLLAGLILIYSFITQRTVFGRHIYALGGNEKAARLSGVKTQRVMFLVYTNMGLLSALAGLVVAGRLNAATPKAGTMFELDAIGACFIGGASASGGIGTVVGAVVGGLVMGVLNNGMSIMGVSVDWQQAIKGLVLLAAVCFDVYTKNKSHPS